MSASNSPKNRIILGLMTFGPKEEDGARVTDPATLNLALDTFQKRGYNEVDTARMYCAGKQEGYTRDAKWKERGLTLATKVIWSPEPGINSAAKVEESVNTSLKELGTDRIDILYLHLPDRSTPLVETLGALDKLHKAGKFTRLGLSNYAAFEVAEIVLTCKYNNWVRPSIYQAMYNCIARDIEPELLPTCQRYGLDVVVYNPLAGGLFSGKIKSRDIVPDEGRFSGKAATIGKMYRERYFRESTFKSLKIVEEAAQKHNLTMLEIALRWCVHHSKLALAKQDGTDGIIIGVSSVDQLVQNLDDLEKGPLPDEVVKSLDEAWEVSRLDAPTYWRGTFSWAYDTKEVLFGPGAK